ncbi:2-octaprenyl-6-methoxyphenyl hydroxylase [Psychromonas ossibalaenae]|uniref:2-octaprenyl-6-methoxyphenyl hydroxylase n=1 Tax=Psychromonas ossibalaenae TaxID=444922 RepID=UPI000360CB59|nr:2-octaprenyl-6-methoxyphenyl hydroxylase [Psychromonas ossibalaenae]
MDNNTATQLDCDILIVGAGMSGCLLAYSLLKFNPKLDVMLVDENPQRSEKQNHFVHPGFDARSLALSAGTCELLAELGLWDDLQLQAQPIEDIHISDRGYFGALDLHKSNKQQAFGYVAELQDIGRVLNKHLKQHKQLRRLYNSSLTNIEKHPEHISCCLDNGQIIKAKMCVGADGANSVTRELLDIPAQTSDYGCCAVIANVRSSKAHLNKAFERFTEFGPIALLPLSDNRYSLVWSVANEDLVRISALTEPEFLAELQLAFGYRAGVFTEAGKRDTYPLKLIKTYKPLAHRGVCIGNAAHCLHPVMGQGFNLGMRDLYVLASQVSRAESKSQIGSYQMLEQYWQLRRADHHNTIALTDSMVRIFSNSSWPVILGRNTALQAMSCLPDLSTPIIKQAKGQFNLLNRDAQ